MDKKISLITMLAGFTVVAATAVATAMPAQAATTLRGSAEAHGRYFGTELTQGDLGNGNETAIAGTQFDMVTPGNEMKWDTTEPANGSFNFGPADQIVSFAQSHNMRVRGHNLVWHSQLPSWVSSLPLSQVRGAMETHITTEATHYRGKVYSWDVVNEPFNEDGSLRADVFFNAMGSGYVADAIRTAHAADPNAKLYLNDFNIEGINAKSNAMFTLAQQLLAQGVPLNGIGFESHFILGQIPSDMQADMQRFANLGLDVAVTELDDRIQLPASSANLQQQATDFGNVVRDCLGVTRCVGVSQWGVDDGNSWIPGAFPGFGAADMYDGNFQPKPPSTRSSRRWVVRRVAGAVVRCTRWVRAGVWTCRGRVPPRGPGWTSGTATVARTRSGHTRRATSSPSTVAPARCASTPPGTVRVLVPGCRSGRAAARPTSSGSSTPTAPSPAFNPDCVWM